MTGDGETTAFDLAWRAHRAYLVNLAFGMLRDIGAAEDAVQEAFARLAQTDLAAIDDARAWLVVVTSRICLDVIQSARHRRERAVDADTIEFTGKPVGGQSIDPADRITLDDEVRTALLVVLDRLTPAERVVFVMHDVFRTPFDEIATTIGRPAATCRQLARRARQKIEERRGSPTAVDAVQHRQVVDGFIDAATNGDLAALVGLLDPDAWGDIDLGPADRRTGFTQHGSDPVARNILRFFHRRGATLVSEPEHDESWLLAFVERRLWAVIQLDIADGAVRSLHVVADPAQLATLTAVH